MALTYTPEGELGKSLPDFQLPGVDGKIYSSAEFKSATALVVMFICNHCPYVKAIEDRLLSLATRLQPQGAKFIAICANDSTEYPEDSFAGLKKRWQEKNYPFPYLHDESQEVAKRFAAVCTPDFFVYDRDHRLSYRGRFDDSWKDPSRVQKQELSEAVQKLLKGEKPPLLQVPSMGCSIKWKAH
jgi:peroxiredoxin